MKTVQIQYSCAVCGLTDASVNVPERVIDNVIHWFEHIAMPRVMEDHRKRSPDCKPKSLTNIKMPIAPDGTIGKAK